MARPGPKPKCECNLDSCYTCHNRRNQRRHYEKVGGRVVRQTGDELEKRMVAKFKEKGWD